jgi:glutathione synthase/RimK-type ligase-like ATP-grasp enzyme
MLLIITNEADIHPNPVIDHLIKENLPFFRLNTDKLLTDYNITYEINNEKSFFEISYKKHPISINSNQITCAWERRPMQPLATYDHFEEENVKKLILEEADGFLRFFRYAIENVYWIGHPINERKAGSKILQKLIAKKIGFSIPSTLFSNDFKKIKLLKNKELALKPISAFHLTSKNKDLVFYTSKQSYNKLNELGERGFRNNINFIEEYLEKKNELRVTVVGDTCFTAKINSQVLDKEKGSIDWRQGYDHGIKFEKTEIPEIIKTKCLEFLNYFKLNFGCFDFIVDKKGTYHFLECNTNGQWMWLEEEAELPISRKIAELFANEINR